MSRALVEMPPADMETAGGERIFICSGIIGKRELGAKFAKWGTQELLARPDVHYHQWDNKQLTIQHIAEWCELAGGQIDLRGAPQNVRRLKVTCMVNYVACNDNKKDVWNCAGPRKTKAVPVQKNKIKSMTVDIYRCGDVERNPGPNPVLSLELSSGQEKGEGKPALRRKTRRSMRTTHEEECGRAKDELFLAQCNREDGGFNPGNADETQSRFGVKKPKKTEILGDAKQPNTFTVSTMNYRAGMLAGILQPKSKQKQEKIRPVAAETHGIMHDTKMDGHGCCTECGMRKNTNQGLARSGGKGTRVCGTNQCKHAG